jgi:hypothetical protein
LWEQQAGKETAKESIPVIGTNCDIKNYAGKGAYIDSDEIVDQFMHRTL